MAVWSKMKNGKKAAEKVKEDETKASKPKPPPYTHIPTHAATDALNGVSGVYQARDRVAIKEAVEKRKSIVRNASSSSQAFNFSRNSSYYNSNLEGADSVARLNPNPPMHAARSYQPSRLASKPVSEVDSRSVSNSSSSADMVEMHQTHPAHRGSYQRPPPNQGQANHSSYSNAVHENANPISEGVATSTYKGPSVTTVPTPMQPEQPIPAAPEKKKRLSFLNFKRSSRAVAATA